MDELALHYGTDKASIGHGYTSYYERHLGALRDQRIRLVEIGVQYGQSVKMWLDYFPRSLVTGLDVARLLPAIARECADRFRYVLTDVKDFRPPPHARYDVVIDDGSHLAADILQAWDILWPHVVPGGWYVIEDLAVHGPASPALEKVDAILRQLYRESEEFAEVHVYGQIVFIRKGEHAGVGLPEAPELSLVERTPHRHPHGEHLHDHSHAAGDQVHLHGWHAPADVCTGDDAFGTDGLGPRHARLKPAQQIQSGRLLVLVPYVRGSLRDQTVDALRSQSDATIVLQDVGGSQWDYFEAVSRLVDYGEDFAIVEQDIVMPPDGIAQYLSCSEAWDCFDYPIYKGMISQVDPFGVPGAWGAVRFRKQIFRDLRYALDHADRATWSAIAANVEACLVSMGHRPHLHTPPAGHLHDYGTADGEGRKVVAAGLVR